MLRRTRQVQTVCVPILHRAWNHNTRYHRRLLRLVPDGCERALDIGCGDGTFAKRLASKSSEVVALDADSSQVELARSTCAGLVNVSVVHSGLLSADLDHAAFDVVTALASLHHLPFTPAIGKVSELLRPGGRLIVLGVWTDSTTWQDSALNHAASATNRLYQRIWGPDRMDAPATMPEMTLSEIRRETALVLPESSVRRCLLWRYILTWQKPPAPSAV